MSSPATAKPQQQQLERLIADRLSASVAAVESIRDQSATMAAIMTEIVASLKRGGTIYTCGNGGSAAQALHLAEELIGRYRTDRPPLRAICLNADPTALTCIANDFGFDQVFARPCNALLDRGDILVVFSTSGRSPNIVGALKAAARKGATSIGLLGKDGGECQALCDMALLIRGADSATIQDAHQLALHLICEAVEQSFAEV